MRVLLVVAAGAFVGAVVAHYALYWTEVWRIRRLWAVYWGYHKERWWRR